MEKLKDLELSKVIGGAIITLTNTYLFDDELEYLVSNGNTVGSDDETFEISDKSGRLLNNGLEVVALLKDMPNWCGVIIKFPVTLSPKGTKMNLIKLGVPDNKIYIVESALGSFLQRSKSAQ